MCCPNTMYAKCTCACIVRCRRCSRQTNGGHEQTLFLGRTTEPRDQKTPQSNDQNHRSSQPTPSVQNGHFLVSPSHSSQGQTDLAPIHRHHGTQKKQHAGGEGRGRGKALASAWVSNPSSDISGTATPAGISAAGREVGWHGKNIYRDTLQQTARGN